MTGPVDATFLIPSPASASRHFEGRGVLLDPGGSYRSSLSAMVESVGVSPSQDHECKIIDPDDAQSASGAAAPEGQLVGEEPLPDAAGQEPCQTLPGTESQVQAVSEEDSPSTAGGATEGLEDSMPLNVLSEGGIMCEQPAVEPLEDALGGMIVTQDSCEEEPIFSAKAPVNDLALSAVQQGSTALMLLGSGSASSCSGQHNCGMIVESMVGADEVLDAVISTEHDNKSAAPQRKTDSLFQCYICLGMFLVVINKGTKDYPKYVCRPCWNSSRWLEKSLVSRNVNVATYKRDRWPKYRIDVLKFRIADGNDSQEVTHIILEAIGEADTCRSWQERRNMSSYLDEVSYKEKEFYSGGKIAWLTERQFIGYKVNKELYTKTEALQLWNEAKMTKTFRSARRTAR